MKLGFGKAVAKDTEGRKEFFWFAYTNSDGNVILTFNSHLPKRVEENIAEHSKPDWVLYQDDHTILLSTGNEWRCIAEYPCNMQQVLNSRVLGAQEVFENFWVLQYFVG